MRGTFPSLASFLQSTLLPEDFYLNEDVVWLARQFIGKILVSRVGGIAGGIIVETEAYRGIHDRACHAWGGRRTKRTEVMYRRGGTAYVYFTYGLHHLFNIVTNKEEIPEAILVRGIIPILGIDLIRQRRQKETPVPFLCDGPACVTQALAITVEHTGSSLINGPITIHEAGIIIPDEWVENTPRIGVDYAGEDALLPYRFVVKKKYWEEIFEGAIARFSFAEVPSSKA